MRNFEILTVTNDPFVGIVKNLLVSFEKYHPSIKVNVVCVNLKEQSYKKLETYHSNINLIKFNKKFNFKIE